MENFIVSARKYRPATFNTVVGQHVITATLKNAIKNNHLAQAFLFCGPRGVGKTTCARILAKTINCENLSSDIEPCNTCKSCLSFNKSASFNVHELDAASNNSVEDIRNLVDQVRIPPQIGKYKVYIIDEVHMLSASAFNAFLKTLEEPPAYAKFILATTEKHRIIPTILSRCQIYDFKRISVTDAARHLAYVAEQEGIKAEPEALHVIAQKSDGAMRDALSIFDQIVSFSGHEITYANVIENLNVLDYDYYFKMTEAVQEGNITRTLLLINEIIENGFDGQHFIIGFGEHIRNLLVSKNRETLKLLETGESIRKKYLEQSGNCPPEFLLRSLEILNQCDINYKGSNNKNLLLELSLLQICALSQHSSGRDNREPDKVEERKAAPSYQSKNTGAQTGAVATKPAHKVKQAASPGEIPRTTSIRLNEKKEEKQETNGVQNQDVARARNSFSQTDLEKMWDEYAESIKSDAPLYATLKKRKPALGDNFLIHFTVDNKLLADMIRDKKADMIPFMRKKLGNDYTDVLVEITKSEKEVKIYTPDDKYNSMTARNPELKKLKEDLGLEID